MVKKVKFPFNKTLNKMNNTVAKKGNIQYYFKGMKMRVEPASVFNYTSNDTMVVIREADDQPIEFVHNEGNWLLKTVVSKNDPLYGTQFVFKY
jgi:hypothetical protein